MRLVRAVSRSRPTIEGAGVHLNRAFGYHHVPRFDPFLLLDDFSGDDPAGYLSGFPWHPHRGIETITYVLGGEVAHGDSMENSGVIRAGDVQWMTAGSGVVHREMPRGDANGVLRGYQLWANLPAASKMMPPRYRGIEREEIPEVDLPGGATARVICGELRGERGPARDIVIDPEYLDVTVPAGSVFEHPTTPGHTVLAYVIEGTGRFQPPDAPREWIFEGRNYFDFEDESLLCEETLVLYGDGPGIAVSTDAEPVRFLLVSGRPLGEPVAWRGPIVMNTDEELQVAFREFHEGTFLDRSG